MSNLRNERGFADNFGQTQIRGENDSSRMTEPRGKQDAQQGKLIMRGGKSKGKK